MGKRKYIPKYFFKNENSKEINWGKVSALAAIAGVLVSIILWVLSNKSQENSTTKEKSIDTTKYSSNTYCNFPTQRDSNTLYIIITRFEDVASENPDHCRGLILQRKIEDIARTNNQNIFTVYADTFFNQRSSAALYQENCKADFIFWGYARNSEDNSCDGDVCFNFKPSDEIISLSGGSIKEKSDLEYIENITASDIEEGKISLSGKSLEHFIVNLSNVKIGIKNPKLYAIPLNQPKKVLIQEFKNRGYLFFTLTSYKEAINDLNFVIELDSQDAQNYLIRGYSKYLLKSYNKAINDFNVVLKLNAYHEIGYWFRGDAKSMIGKHQEAIKDYNMAIKLNPLKSNYYSFRGLEKLNLGYYEEAVNDFDTAIKLNPKDDFYYASRGRSKLKMKKYKEAINDLNKAIKLNSKDAHYYSLRGQVKSELKKFSDAVNDYNKAIALSIKDDFYYSLRGQAKLKLKKYNEAVNDYSMAIDLNPNNYLYYFLRGEAYYYLTNYEESIRDYNIAIGFDSTQSFINFYKNESLKKLKSKKQQKEDPSFLGFWVFIATLIFLFNFSKWLPALKK
jgi:tetratricopeptide (TPR) repeat protein